MQGRNVDLGGAASPTGGFGQQDPNKDQPNHLKNESFENLDDAEPLRLIKPKHKQSQIPAAVSSIVDDNYLLPDKNRISLPAAPEEDFDSESE